MSHQRLLKALGYEFRDGKILERALTHRSASRGHNERMEFLGDGLLNGIVGELLFHHCPKATEGDLSRLRASLVREETLAAIANELNLGDEMNLGSGELKSGGFRRASILADALEALIAAVYLDGGFEATHRMLKHLYGQRLQNLPDPATLKDAKTRLQECLQGDSRPRPEYGVERVEGPPHKQRFYVHCRLPDSGEVEQAEGPSRRVAEQRAAQRMIDRITP